MSETNHGEHTARPETAMLVDRVMRAHRAAEDLATGALETASRHHEASRDLVSLLHLAARLEQDLYTLRLGLTGFEAGIAADRAKAEENAFRTARLARVARALCESMTLDQVAVTIAAEGLGALQADTVFVLEVTSEGDALDLVAAINYPREVFERYTRIPLDAPLPAAEALREDNPLFLMSRREVVQRFPLALAAMQELQAEAVAAVPFTANGSVRGVLAMTYSHSHIFDEGERTFAITLAQLCAHAMVRGRLYDSAQVERRRAEEARARAEAAAHRLLRLQKVTTSLCDTESRREVAEIALAEGRVATGAAAGAICLLDGASDQLQVLSAQGLSDSDVKHVAGKTMSDISVVRDAIVSALPQFLTIDEFRHRFGTPEHGRGAPFGSIAAVPLRTAGTPFGAILFTYGSAEAISHDDHSFLCSLADQCAIALERRKLTEAASAATVAKTQFLASASHELLTPLTAILGNLELIEGGFLGPVSPAIGDTLTRVRASGEHLHVLVHDLLGFVELSQGTARVRPGRCDARAIINHAIAAIEPLIGTKGVRLVRELPDTPLLLDTDCDKLEQIVTNLVVNAGRFTDEGEIRVRALLDDDDLLVIEVSDTGAGIPEQDRDRVFHPFFQMDQSYTRRVGGLGLGLTVARDLARLLGGDLQLDGNVDDGSVFRLTVPLSRPETPARTRATARA